MDGPEVEVLSSGPSTMGEEAMDEELSLTEVSNTNDILAQMVLQHHDEHDHYPMDVKEEQIFHTIRNKIKAGPKPPIMEAEEQKQGIERQLEDNTKQFETLLEFGELLLSNIGALREMTDKFRRDMITAKRRELNRRIRQESIEAEAKYSMIRSKWMELDMVNDPLEFYWQADAEKKNVDQLLQTKDKLIADCQAEIERLNGLFDDDMSQQNQDLDCFGKMILNQTDLLTKATQGQIELLEGAVDDEWQYMCLLTKQKWYELHDLVNYNTEQVNEIIKAKDELYENEINKLMFEQKELTRETNVRLEKEAADLQLELRKARTRALMNSERLDYNYNVLQHRYVEDITLNNQQKRRIGKIVQKIADTKYKLTDFMKESNLKFEKLSTNIEKLHASISDLQIKQKAFRLRNKKQFDKVWDIEYEEIKKVLNEVFEIDKLFYRTQLAKCWDPIECDLSDLKQIYESPKNNDPTEASSDSIELNPEERQKELERKIEKEKHAELRFLRNVLRKVSKRSKIFFEGRLFAELAKYAADEKLTVCVENIFRVFRITDVDMIKELTEYLRPYAFCPKCQSPPREKIIGKLYNLRLAEIPEDTEEVKKCNDPAPVDKPECKEHALVAEPLLVLTALREFVESKGTDFEMRESEFQIQGSFKVDSVLSVEKINEYFENLNNSMSKQRLDTWKAMEHGLTHFEVLLEERRRLDEECLKLSRQNAELRYFIGDHIEVPDIPSEPTKPS